jgi:hypothetical protein
MNEQIAGQENFSLPHDIVVLPSEGKYYKNKKKSVKVGYLTAVDENLIVSLSTGEATQMMSQLIRNKLYEPELSPYDMLEGDIEAILIFLRNTSFGPEYNFTLIDPETGKEFSHSIVLDELTFIKPNVEPDSEGLLKTTLPKSNVEIKLKLLTYGELMDIDRATRKYVGGQVKPIVTNKLSKQIVEINGSRDANEITSFISKMPIMDSKYISKFILENEPRIDFNREIIAPSGKKVLTKIAFGAEFFRPFF